MVRRMGGDARELAYQPVRALVQSPFGSHFSLTLSGVVYELKGIRHRSFHQCTHLLRVAGISSF